MRKPTSYGCRGTAELELDFGFADATPAKAGVTPKANGNGSHGVSFEAQLAGFDLFGRKTAVAELALDDPEAGKVQVPVFSNEFWTARQRQANSLHEISYRACFKPQLPRFFIERLSEPGDVVYDPFMGRGTTPLEAGLLGRVPMGNDINPLSITMTRPRLHPPTLDEVAERLRTIPLDRPGDLPEELTVFYHPETLIAISSLRRYFMERRESGMDFLDEWIAMVSLNRLTGHSKGFFSVYTLPPNQAVSVASQRKINERRSQTPEPRNVAALILKKSRQLLGDVTTEARSTLQKAGQGARFFTCDASATREIPSNSVCLAATSPPFLNVVQYATDNWLRCWFLGIDSKAVQLTLPSAVPAWRAMITGVLAELRRVLRPGGHLAFEVGEVEKGSVRLEDVVLPAGKCAGLEPRLVFINEQVFTKTANCWGVDNMSKGTNTNRIVVFRKA